MQKINLGDKVYNTRTNEKGKVKSLYPELNKAIVETSDGVVKADLFDLVPLNETNDSADETEIKKTSLLDKIKARVSGREYD